ncbi:hypothetical protein FB45DRAFT_1022543 [Roridomyces roridus]|uniref:Uncharacterized protein n=1 Tax=Roridomyces roridus TaxID=1738132 RepID=A0AAD7C8M8_9AGAR|nr:hypothetical protein FB45DRAFT_1022543 [Roridomyces roridus]
MPSILHCVALLLGISATLNVITLYRLRRTPSRSSLNIDEHPLDSELPLPIGAATLEFIFGKHYDIADSTAWATLFPHPEHGGRVRLEDKEFDVGMYTDLKCLDVIRSAYVRMRSGAQVRDEAAEACLGHIRQAILCTADITLEPTKIHCTEDGECPLKGATASGEYLDHRCRDWTQVRQFVEDNQAGWSIKDS